jgi:hypothetical protein
MHPYSAQGRWRRTLGLSRAVYRVGSRPWLGGMGGSVTLFECKLEPIPPQLDAGNSARSKDDPRMKVFGNENSPRRSLFLARNDPYVREQLRECFWACNASFELDDDGRPCGISRGNIDAPGFGRAFFATIDDLQPRFKLLDVRTERGLEVPLQSERRLDGLYERVGTSFGRSTTAPAVPSGSLASKRSFRAF